MIETYENQDKNLKRYKNLIDTPKVNVLNKSNIKIIDNQLILLNHGLNLNLHHHGEMKKKRV